MNSRHFTQAAWLGFAVTSLGVLTLLFYVDPVHAVWFPACPIHKLTGLDCPGCGSGRGIHALLHGQIVQAADYNLLLIPALLTASVGLYNKSFGGAKLLWALLNRPRFVLTVIIIFWLARNIPFYPLSWLNSGS